MHNFLEVVNDYVKNVVNKNDRRIMLCALNILEAEEIISNDEINILNEIFMALKEDYTLAITQDRETLDFMIAIKKQEAPIIENKHDVNVLCNELKRLASTMDTTVTEKSIINFFCACEHIEENEVLVIEKIIDSIVNNWALNPIEQKEENGELIRYTKFIPTYTKGLVKTNK